MTPAPEYDPRYLSGAELFNRGDYFAAHEVWEDLWRDCPAADRRFYQCLIQAAVALYHLGRGNRSGADRVAARGRSKVSGYPVPYRGLDAPAFWQRVDAALAGGGPAPRIILQPFADDDGPDDVR